MTIPGGILNAGKDQFAINPSEPNMPFGARGDACTVIYESPLQMLCLIPAQYIENPNAWSS